MFPSLFLSSTEPWLQPETRNPESQAPVHWNMDHSVINWPKLQAHLKVPQGKKSRAGWYAIGPRIKRVLFFLFHELKMYGRKHEYYGEIRI